MPSHFEPTRRAVLQTAAAGAGLAAISYLGQTAPAEAATPTPSPVDQLNAGRRGNVPVGLL